jgi:hypothetical protein
MVSDPDMIVPGERQIRILESVRARIALRWETTELKHEQHFKHWEDPELDIPPIGESAGFCVKLPVLSLHVGTPLPWESSPRSRLRISFSSYDGGPGDAQWPWHDLVKVMTADEIISIARQPDGKTLITSVTAGRRTSTRVSASDARLLEWWWASNGRSPGPEQEKT